MISHNNKNIKAILSDNKEIIRITDTITGEIVWEKTIIPAEIDYFYVQNTYNGTNTLTLQQTLTGTLDSNTYAKQIEYSKDKTNWTTVTLSSTAYRIPINSGEKVYFRGDEGVFNYWVIGGTSKAITTINCSQQYIIGGNINTLLDYNNPNSLTLPQGAFNSVFQNDTNLKNASEVTLQPSVDGSLSAFVYCYLFDGCTGLTAAPTSIPATKQGKASCYCMFKNCSSLTQAPTLPATTLSTNCYCALFRGCTSLTQAPVLTATTLASRCYSEMYFGCSRLTTASNLPATTLTDGCYWNMYRNCSSLTTAPTIQATTLAGNSCNSMFMGCTSLTQAPTLLATTLANYSYNQMFYGCSSLNEVTTYATDISATDCTKNWLYGVANSGTFYNNGSANFTVNSPNGIPTGWTNVVPGVVEPDYFYIENLYNGNNTLTLTTLNSGSASSDLYSNTVEYSKDKESWTKITLGTPSPKITITMSQGEKVYFRNDNGKWNYYYSENGFGKDYHYTEITCSQIINVGGNLNSLLDYTNIDSVTPPICAFYSLFYNNTKLVNAANLVFTHNVISDRVLEYTFSGCSSLTTPPNLSNVTSIGNYGLQGTFYRCTSLTTPPNLSNVTSIGSYGLSNSFDGCSSLTNGPDLSNVTSIGNYGLKYAFYGCYKISTVTAPNVSDLTKNHILDEWLIFADDDVTDTKTVNVPTGATINTDSTSGIPTGWVRVDY